MDKVIFKNSYIDIKLTAFLLLIHAAISLDRGVRPPTMTFAQPKDPLSTASPIIQHATRLVHLPVRPLMLSLTICHCFTPRTLHDPFRLSAYSVTRTSHMCTRPCSSLTLTLYHHFRYHFLDALPHLGFAFPLPTYGINQYGNKGILRVMEPRHRRL